MYTAPVSFFNKKAINMEKSIKAYKTPDAINHSIMSTSPNIIHTPINDKNKDTAICVISLLFIIHSDYYKFLFSFQIVCFCLFFYLFFQNLLRLLRFFYRLLFFLCKICTQFHLGCRRNFIRPTDTFRNVL